MKNSKVVVPVIILFMFVIGIGSFFAGMKYQQGRQPSRADFQAMRGMRQGTPGVQRPEGSEAVRGEIIDSDERSITVKLPDGGSKIILISANIEINKTTEGSVGDLETGKQVMIFGQENSDGSITAQNIQLNPILR